MSNSVGAAATTTAGGATHNLQPAVSDSRKMQSNSRDIPKTCMNCKFDSVGGVCVGEVGRKAISNVITGALCVGSWGMGVKKWNTC